VQEEGDKRIKENNQHTFPEKIDIINILKINVPHE